VIISVSCDLNSDPVNYASLTGIYTCQEYSSHAGVRQYPVEIDKVSDSENLYIISNFHNKGESEFLFAELSLDTLRISNQAISELTVNGKGTVGKDFRSILLNYLTDDGQTILDYSSTYSR